jgi:hypothetical protein
MPAPLPLPLRQRIREQQQRGVPAAAIARRLGLPARTVRALCARFRAGGSTAVPPATPDRAAAVPPPAVEQALLLHAQHPGWGAPYLLLQLRLQQPELRDLPRARTLQRWFARRRLPAAPAGRKPARERTLAQRPHAVWQMDAVEQLPLRTGQQVSWLRWVDEWTGAVLGTAVFPPRPLRRSAVGPGPAGTAAAIRPLGLAGLPAGGQRPALGQ